MELVTIDGEVLEEEWSLLTDVPEHSISNYGRVVSHRKDELVRPRLSGWGYLQVVLYVRPRRITKTVHHMVAEHFVPGQDRGLVADHINGDKMVNGEWNLEWITRRENNARAVALGLRKYGSTAVRIVGTDQEFKSVKDCAAFLGTYSTAVSSVLTGKRPHYKGLTFEYV